jgi:ATP-dependent DNA helicase DinG
MLALHSHESELTAAALLFLFPFCPNVWYAKNDPNGHEGMTRSMKFAVLDFETTGSQPTDEIIQVGLAIIENDTITQTYGSFVNPGMPIPPFIEQLTGITDEVVEQAPVIDDILMQFYPLMADCILVGHQISFDLSFLQRTLGQCGYEPFSGPVIDTMDAFRMFFPALSSLQLNMVTASLDISHDRPHHADSDAEATAQAWLQCMERLRSLPLLTLQRLVSIVDSGNQDMFDLPWLIQQILTEKELQLSIDLDAGKYHRQFALNVDDWTEEQPPRSANLSEAGLEPSFDPFYAQLKQELQLQFDSFEDRKAQEQMIHEVYQSLTEDNHLVIEAGTGTGKSLGYLIPSLYYGIQHGSKIVISTNTIQLQEQMRDRDIPLLQQIFPIDFKASVLKGRSHYLCLRKFEHKINNRDYDNSKDHRIAAAQMVVWLGETTRGDDEEIHLGGNQGADFWRSVESDTDSCLNRSCPWFKKCFYHRARHEANISDVVITNHSLLFTDVKAENRLLPAYDHLIIDEAHHFEEVAAKHLGIDIHYFSLVNTLTWLYKDSKNGYLPMLRFRLQKAEDEQSASWCATIDEMYPKLITVKEQWDSLTELLYAQLARDADSNQSEVGQHVLRVHMEKLPKHWDKLNVMEDNIYVELTNTLKKLEKLLGEIKEKQDEFHVQGAITDLGGMVKDLYRHRDALRFFMKLSDPGYVYWIEANPLYKSKSLQLLCVPIDVSDKLKQHFFDTKDSVVMTSATLSVDKSFQYTCDQLGLDLSSEPDRVKTVLLPSPFNYREQALVCIPRDFPSVRGTADQLFIDTLVRSLRDVAIETNGRMLVLFTSYRMLKGAYELLKDELVPHGIQVLGQGIDSGNRTKLTRMFRNGAASVLLGTSSFWEGIDIPGEALSCLAIVRLPFQPPNHPLVEAKSEALKKRNKNPFMSFSVPQAVIRFKQGFGRLVRTAKDRGIVVIYDTRVIDTYYGKYFLYSLPGPKIEHMSTNQMVPRIREWLQLESKDAFNSKRGETV